MLRTLLFLKTISMVDALLLMVLNVLFAPHYLVAFGIWFVYFVGLSFKLMVVMIPAPKTPPTTPNNGGDNDQPKG